MTPDVFESLLQRWPVIAFDMARALSQRLHDSENATILDLREKAKKALKKDFDIREFHDVVLKNGAVPLPILEGLVDDYIAKKKAA